MATNPNPSRQGDVFLPSPTPRKGGAGLIAQSPWYPWTRLSCSRQGCQPRLHASWASCLYLVSTSELKVVLGDMPHTLSFVTQSLSLKLVASKLGQSFFCEHGRSLASVTRQYT